MNKRDKIIQAMLQLLLEDKGVSCSVSDIAKEAGIGKGSVYYYFKSKDEIFDAVVDHIYQDKIDQCRKAVENSQDDAVKKLGLLFSVYGQTILEPSVDAYLHQQQNAAIHQKSLAQILLLLSPLVADIFRQGVQEKLFDCEHPQETAELFLSAFCFLLDPGIFTWSDSQLLEKIKALAELFEKGLSAPQGSLKFLYAGFQGNLNETPMREN